MPRRHTSTFAALVAVAALGTACSDDADGSTQPDPPSSAPTSTATSTPTEDPEPGGPPAGWEDEFTAEQLTTYNAALARYKQYRRATDPIYRDGKDTPEARALLQEYSALWQRDVVELAEYDRGGIRTLRAPEPLWTYARSVKPTYVVIVQCTDYTNVQVTQNGEEVTGTKPKHLLTPLAIKMDKPEGRWLFAGVSLKDRTSCAA